MGTDRPWGFSARLACRNLRDDAVQSLPRILAGGDGPSDDDVIGACHDGFGWGHHSSLISLGSPSGTDARGNNEEIRAEMPPDDRNFLGGGDDAIEPG